MWPRRRNELVGQMEELRQEVHELRQELDKLRCGSRGDEIFTYVFPGGQLPERKTDGAAGYDVYVRAIVDPVSKPTPENPMRATFADFLKTDGWLERIHPSIIDWVRDDPEGRDEFYAIDLPDQKRCMVGIGIATAMDLPRFLWLTPRSGYASKGVTLGNAPGTIDPDYRGEAGALVVNESGGNFTISKQMRISQFVVSRADLPEFVAVENYTDLPGTTRGVGGFGSTGSH